MLFRAHKAPQDLLELLELLEPMEPMGLKVHKVPRVHKAPQDLLVLKVYKVPPARASLLVDHLIRFLARLMGLITTLSGLPQSS